MTKFKTDENIPVEAAHDLQRAGYDAMTIADQHMAGQPDVRVAEVCRMEGRALLTLDLDFSDIRVFPPGDSPGIIILRPAVQTVKNIQRLVRQVVALLCTERLDGHLLIVDEGQIRVRT